MFGSNWKQDAAISGIVLITLVLGWIIFTAPDGAPYSWKNNYSKTYKSSRHLCATELRASGHRVTSITDESPVEPEDERRNAELCQQVRMAQAAESASDATWLQFWLVGLPGVALLILTTYFAGRAASYACDAAEAGKDAVTEARNQVALAEFARRNIQRPYVFNDRFDMFPMVKNESPDQIVNWQLALAWKNFGHTPAKNIVGVVSIKWFDSGKSPEDLDFPDFMKFRPHGPTLGPGQFYYVRNAISADDLIKAWKGEGQIIYWGWVEYDGLEAGVRQRTEVCAGVLPLGDPMIKTTHFHNIWLTRFNAADCDCVHKPKTSEPKAQ